MIARESLDALRCALTREKTGLDTETLVALPSVAGLAGAKLSAKQIFSVGTKP